MKKLLIILLLIPVFLQAQDSPGTALKGFTKTIVYKGVPYSYWTIIRYEYSKERDLTTVTLVPYYNKETRLADVNSYIPDLRKQYELKGIVESLDAMYDSVAVSKKQTRIITPEVPEKPAVVDPMTHDTITPYVPAIPAVTEEIETNYFADLTPE